MRIFIDGSLLTDIVINDVQIGAVEIKDATTATRMNVDVVEVDIDGLNAGTENALIYGSETPGTTHPVHVDSDGNIIVSGVVEAIYAEALPTAQCTVGAAIEFDITSFTNLANIEQINIVQTTAGTYDYTFEIWETHGASYDPADYTTHYLKIFSRDIDVREYNENIEGSILYRDRDDSSELHCRIVNNAAGTTSTFYVSIVAVDGE